MKNGKYLTAGENFKVKCSDQALISSLVELYSYHFKKAVELEDSPVTAKDAYTFGVHDGATKALEAILLLTLGGRATYEIWEKTMKWANSGTEED